MNVYISLKSLISTVFTLNNVQFYVHSILVKCKLIIYVCVNYINSKKNLP